MAVTERRGARRKSPAGPRGRGAGRRIAAGLAGVALAAAAVHVQQNVAMPVEQRTSFLTYQGRVGETVRTERFTVKVVSVAAARELDTADDSGQVTRVETSNLFLLVEVSATSAREPMRLSRLSPPVLRTRDGRRYDPTDKVSDGLTLFGKPIQPGFWVTGPLLFEVPADAVPGARLVFIPPAGPVMTDAYAPEAEIDLGLSGSAAERLIAQAEDHHSLVGTSR